MWENNLTSIYDKSSQLSVHKRTYLYTIKAIYDKTQLTSYSMVKHRKISFSDQEQDTTKKLLALISKFSNIAVYKINIQKLVVFLKILFIYF